MKKKRLDEILIEKGDARDKNDAFVLVTEGHVFVDGQKAIAPAQPVREDAVVEIRGMNSYVGRGAKKLEAAILKFKPVVENMICADVGAATGGFTEILLKHGAKKVYAIDTTRGKLAEKIRRDPRVMVMESTDVRDIGRLPDPISLATIDVSLISLTGILPAVRRFLAPDGAVIALFKPQYETRDQKDLRHGIIKDDSIREKLLHDFSEWLDSNGWKVEGQMMSPIKGGEGNTEYLFLLR